MTSQETTVKKCDLCDGADFELIARRDRKGGELPTDVCRTCGLVSHRNIPTAEELASFYATDYRVAYHGEITPSVRRVMRAWKNGQRIYQQLAPCLEPGTDVFEVGAGIGCTVKVFQQNGHPATGIEPNNGFQAYAQHQLHARVTHDDLFNLNPVPRHKLVLLIHVIEHFRSPKEALRHLHQIIHSDGLLYVECPNLGAPFAFRPKLFHFAHTYNFTRWTLAALAQRCGFEVVRWFGAEDDSCLQVLLRRVPASGSICVPPDGYTKTIAAINRFNLVSYHFRRSYARTRLRIIASYAWELVAAKRYVRHLLASIPPPIPNRRGEQKAA